MKPKALLNLLPIVAIVVVGLLIYRNGQQPQVSELDYDNPDVPAALMTSAKSLPRSEYWQVVKVSDGDTLTVRSDDKEQTLRLCGVDAPEKAQPLGDAARERLQSLVSGAGGQLIVMPIEQDRYGRTVAEVFVKKPNRQEETFVNGEMVKAGMAYHYERYSGRCVNRMAIERSEAIAKGKKVGVWSGNYQRPWDHRRQQRGS